MKWALLIVLLSAGSSYEASDTTNFFEKWNGKLLRIADEIRARLSATASRSCECSYYACGRPPPDEERECLESKHNEQLDCGVNYCGHMNVCHSPTCGLLSILCIAAQRETHIRSRATFGSTRQLRQRNQERHLLDTGAFMLRFHCAGRYAGSGRCIHNCQRVQRWICSLDLLWGSRDRNLRVLCILMHIRHQSKGLVLDPGQESPER